MSQEDTTGCEFEGCTEHAEFEAKRITTGLVTDQRRVHETGKLCRGHVVRACHQSADEEGLETEFQRLN